MNTQQRLRAKIIATPLLIAMVSGLCIAYILDDFLVDALKNKIEQDAEWKARSVLSFLSVGDFELDMSALDKVTDSLAIHQERITIVADDGQVLADSMQTLEQLYTLDNHAKRPEIIMAKNMNAIGTSWRYSNTVKTEMLYKAIHDVVNGVSITVRVAIPLTVIQEDISRLHWLIIKMIGVGVFLVLLLSVSVARLLTREVDSYQQQLVKQVEERTSEIKTLEKLGHLLTACKDSDAVAQVVQSIMPKLFKKSMVGALLLIDELNGQLQIVGTWGGATWQGDESYKLDECLAMNNNHYQASNDKNGYCSHLTKKDQDQVCLPLSVQEKMLGSLRLEACEKAEITDDELEVALSVAEYISLALLNIQQKEKLEEMALRDPLTKLYNRRYLEEAGQQSISNAQRNDLKLAVLVLDIDHFKRFNDNFGHEAGDHVLAEVGGLFKKMSRNNDLLCRYGGEEFVIVSTVADEMNARVMANKYCKSVRDLSLDYFGELLPSVTLSIGVAVYPDNGLNLTELLRTADKALYQAKSQGRNRVVMTF
ncbi:MAG: diguanylate cyclase (GGDEF)-like protein [Cycloclasticus sp.]|jgi:diguanylate cyclase (GGDEF)-like protein